MPGAAAPARTGPAGGLLVLGVVLAALTEAVAGTALSLGRLDMLGDTHATPDQFAWLDVAYVAAKLVGFIAAPGLMQRFAPRALLVAATLAMGLACGLAALTPRLDLLVALRGVQGLSGGVLLVCGQAMLFLAFRRSRQPILQALFAIGAVVAPATLVPALLGWLVDQHAWPWIFMGILPAAMLAAGLLLLAGGPPLRRSVHCSFDWIGSALLSVALSCLVFGISQGNRWDWFEEGRIAWTIAIGVGSLLVFLGRRWLAGGPGLAEFSLFRCNDFSFAFVVSFVAGAALFGSAYLIPSFAVSVLGLTPTDAGRLLLPSSALFVAALLLAAYLMQVRRLPPIATVPFGIVLIMVSMWMLSGSNGESGLADMMGAILLRGLGLGFLFLSIILIAFGNLDSRHLAQGIGLFNVGRQLGGLLGVAGLQTMIHHDVAGNLAILGAGITGGDPGVAERLATLAAGLAAKGLDLATASHAASGLLGHAVVAQSTVIAFDTAFRVLSLSFVVAAPVLVAVRIGLAVWQPRPAQATR